MYDNILYFANDVKARNQLEDSGIIVIPITNAVSPSTQSLETTRLNHQVTGMLLSENGINAGLLITPHWANKRGKLHLDTEVCLSGHSAKNINTESSPETFYTLQLKCYARRS